MIDPLSVAAAGKKLVSVAAPSRPEELDPDAARFAELVTGTGRTELSRWWADHIRLRRMRSQLRIFEKAQQYAAQAGYKPAIVNLKVLVPLLETGSLEEEEDDEMINRWAALLANAASRDSQAEVLPGFVDILGQLMPIDASILDALYLALGRVPVEFRSRTFVTEETIRIALSVSDEPIYAISVENLYRLRLAAPPAQKHELSGATYHERSLALQVAGTARVCLTDFGCAFIAACHPPESS